jgi:CRISPR-associated protein Cmr3
MPTWIIEPRDPLVVRDGRPFGPDPGVRATSLPFPFPSTTTGAVRHKAGLGADGSFDRARIPDVKTRPVRGPLLVRLDEDENTIAEWFAPAPADALVLETEQRGGALLIRQLVPLSIPPGAAINLSDELLPVGQTIRLPNKPYDDAPRFWRWDVFERWLRMPQEVLTILYRPKELGLRRLAVDWRVHVSIQPEQQTAVEGALFQTGGLVFTSRDLEDECAGRLVTERLALAVASEGNFERFAGGIAPIGGERRLAAWRRTEAAFPACPTDLSGAIARERACRLVLLTPALFTQGALPRELLAATAGVTPRLIAAAVPRAQTVSGWDMEVHNANGTYGAPKPTRRLVSAGAVYFIQFDDADDPAAIARWVTEHWMTCVSDELQDCRDGFGLAVLGVGSRAGVTMEASSATP